MSYTSLKILKMLTLQKVHSIYQGGSAHCLGEGQRYIKVNNTDV